MTEGIVRVGNTARKPPSENPEFVHRLLIHLEQVGFHGAPRFLGVDEKGRDIFTFIEGFTYVEWFDEVLSDAKLAAIGGLLRAFHDATDGTPLVTRQEVVVHNDAGPFNMVWVDERPVALIDFGAAKPGDRFEDLGYAL